MKTMKSAIITICSILGALALTSCEKTPDTPGEKLDESIEKASDTVKDAGHAISEKIEDAGDVIGDKVEDAGDAIKDATN